MTDVEHDQISKYLQTLIRTINQEMSKAGCKPNEDFAIGIAERIGQMNVSDILAQADNALQKRYKRIKHSIGLKPQSSNYSPVNSGGITLAMPSVIRSLSLDGSLSSFAMGMV